MCVWDKWDMNETDVNDPKVSDSLSLPNCSPPKEGVKKTVKDIRIFFEKGLISKRERICPVRELKINQPEKTRLRAFRQRHLSTVSTIVKVVKDTRTKKRGHASLTPKENRNTADSEGEIFVTPPASPATVTRRKKNIKQEADFLRRSDRLRISIHSWRKDKNCVMEVDQQQHQERGESLNSPSAPSSPSVDAAQAKNTMDATTEVVNISTVLCMFKRLEDKFDGLDKKIQDFEAKTVVPNTEDINKRIESLEKKQENVDLNSNWDSDEVSNFATNLANCKKENVQLKRAVIKLTDMVEELTQRVGNLETNNSKKMITLSGFESQDDKEIVPRLRDFFEEHLGFRPSIEDSFPIGSQNPPVRVVVLMNLQHKKLIMEYKQLLKGAKNSFNQQYYVNDYFQPEIAEKKRIERELFNNWEGPEDTEMEYVKGKLHIDGSPYSPPIVPPKPHDIVDMSVEQLDEILAVKLLPTAKIEEQGNVFIGYSISTDSAALINKTYMKLRLEHPRARHIMCGYMFSDDPAKGQGNCDDGEHGVSKVILKFLKDNNIQNRAIFVVRYYNGIKIGNSRHQCVLQAAKSAILLYPFNAILQQNQSFVPNLTTAPTAPKQIQQKKASYAPYRGRGSNGGSRGNPRRSSLSQNRRTAGYTYGRGSATNRGYQHRPHNQYRGGRQQYSSKRRRQSSDSAAASFEEPSSQRGPGEWHDKQATEDWSNQNPGSFQ